MVSVLLTGFGTAHLTPKAGRGADRNSRHLQGLGHSYVVVIVDAAAGV